MASKLMDRLRRTLFKEGEVVSKEPIDVTEESFPESSELEDDTECLSERLGGTLCFDGESALESEDPGEASGPDSDSDYLGESIEDGFSSTDTSPVGPSPGGSSLLTRQLQDSWSLRFRSVPQKLVFEVTDASVVQESSSKYVLYTIHLIQSGMFDETPAAITRRYTDFKRLHSCLRRRHRDNMERVGFPRKKLRKNFVAETIAKRSRAFEQYLTHMHSLAELRRSPTFLEFFYLGDLQAGQMLMRVGRYQEALGPLLNGLRLQEKLGCEEQGKQQPHHQQGTHWLFTLLALVTCFQELEQLGEAQEHCDRALRDLAPSPEALQQHHFHPLLIPLLQTNVRLSWKISKDKRQWEVLLQEIQDSGADTRNQPSLKEYLIKEALVESEGDTKAKLKREKAT
ncbi:sorting nexin-21-like [Oncorhynchus masou masou]|uniref:sorting nexin-21-like n=1 Tax=Oncorhynchus masou masou TaxID=90313 RepID=UPI0031833121